MTYTFYSSNLRDKNHWFGGLPISGTQPPKKGPIIFRDTLVIQYYTHEYPQCHLLKLYKVSDMTGSSKTDIRFFFTQRVW